MTTPRRAAVGTVDARHEPPAPQRRRGVSLPDLPEQTSPKAARILAAAGDLLVSRSAKGVTMSEVAQKAYVGKGTVYLYWATKEDLILGVIAREYIAFADYLIEQLSAQPGLARPFRFCPCVVRFSADRPLIAALREVDDGRLGALAHDPRSGALDDALGPIAVLTAVLPAWRRATLARDDWPLTDQALAMHLLTAGTAVVLGQSRSTSSHEATLEVYAAAVTALLGAERGSDEQVRVAAHEIIGSLREGRAETLGLIGATA